MMYQSFIESDMRYIGNIIINVIRVAMSLNFFIFHNPLVCTYNALRFKHRRPTLLRPSLANFPTPCDPEIYLRFILLFIYLFLFGKLLLFG
jgi:hypothetical protein